jgi:hypothetical protein
MGFKEQAKALGFIDMINESVHTSDDVDIGDVDAVNRHFIAVKRGFIHIHYYYIPIYKVEGWDGNVLWLKIEEYEVIRKYEVDKVPDPYRYYVKDYPYYTFDYYPVLPTIPSKLIIQSSYPNSLTATTVTAENLNVIQCDLCNSRFGSEDELSNHLSKDHN